MRATVARQEQAGVCPALETWHPKCKRNLSEKRHARARHQTCASSLPFHAHHAIEFFFLFSLSHLANLAPSHATGQHSGGNVHVYNARVGNPPPPPKFSKRPRASDASSKPIVYNKPNADTPQPNTTHFPDVAPSSTTPARLRLVVNLVNGSISFYHFRFFIPCHSVRKRKIIHSR